MRSYSLIIVVFVVAILAYSIGYYVGADRQQKLSGILSARQYSLILDSLNDTKAAQQKLDENIMLSLIDFKIGMNSSKVLPNLAPDQYALQANSSSLIREIAGIIDKPDSGASEQTKALIRSLKAKFAD